MGEEVIRPPKDVNAKGTSKWLSEFTVTHGPQQHSDHGFVRAHGAYHLVCACDGYMKHKWCDHIATCYKEEIVPDDIPTPLVVQVYVKPWLGIIVDLEGHASGIAELIVTGGWKKSGGTYHCSRKTSVAMVDFHPSFREMRRELLTWLPAVPYIFEDSMRCSSVLQHPNQWDWSRVADDRILQRDAFNMFDSRLCAACEDKLFIDDPE